MKDCSWWSPHDWTKWEVTTIESQWVWEKSAHEEIKQTRVCTKCGLRQIQGLKGY